MKRLISVLAVAALMAALLVVSAMPAFAQGNSKGAPNCERGNNTAYFSPGGDKRSDQATRSIDKNYFGTDFQGTDKNENAAYCLRDEQEEE